MAIGKINTVNDNERCDVKMNAGNDWYLLVNSVTEKFIKNVEYLTLYTELSQYSD
jgi:hypothetical protein